MLRADSNSSSVVKTVRQTVRKAKKVDKPDSVVAGEDIAEMRRLSARYLDALSAQCELADNDPRLVRACSKTDRCLKQLFDFGELVKSKIGKSYLQRDDFVVLANLVLAIDDIYLEQLNEEQECFGAGGIDGNRNEVLRFLMERGREDGDRLIAEATAWRLVHGGADV